MSLAATLRAGPALAGDQPIHPDDLRLARHRLAGSSYAVLAAYGVFWPFGIVPVLLFAWEEADRQTMVGWAVTVVVTGWTTALAAFLTTRELRRTDPATQPARWRWPTVLSLFALALTGTPLGLMTLAVHAASDPTNTYIAQMWFVGALVMFLLVVNPETHTFLSFSVPAVAANVLTLALADVGLPRMFVPFIPAFLLGLVVAQHRQLDQTLRTLAGDLTSRRLAARVGEANEQLAAANAELEYRATHDSLTGLITRPAFMTATERALDHAGRTNRFCAVLLMDVDRFKTVNDALGHAAGDQVLVQVAERITRVLGDRSANSTPLAERGLAARHGGDEFTVLLPDVPDTVHALAVAERLRAEVARPWIVDGQRISGTVSMGLALNLDESDRAADLLRHADAALYRVKDAGRDGLEVFDQTLRDSLRRRITDETELRDALASGHIVAWFQPIVDMRDGRIAGAEALARWIHPEHGVLPPGRFLPLLEDAGLLPALGREMAVQAFELRRRIGTLVPDDFRIAINVGVRDQAVPAIVERLVMQAQRSGVAPSGITLEITETAVINDIAGAATSLAEARRHGFAIALDDFGTGYSSLALLRDLELDEVKIDRSFVSGMSLRAADAAVVAGVLDLARRLDLYVVAEGVETQDEVSRLLGDGALYAQGFLYSPAVPGEALEAMLTEGPAWAQTSAKTPANTSVGPVATGGDL